MFIFLHLAHKLQSQGVSVASLILKCFCLYGPFLCRKKVKQTCQLQSLVLTESNVTFVYRWTVHSPEQTLMYMTSRKANAGTSTSPPVFHSAYYSQAPQHRNKIILPATSACRKCCQQLASNLQQHVSHCFAIPHKKTSNRSSKPNKHTQTKKHLQGFKTKNNPN